jgi:proteasome accessory factor C
LRLTAAEGFSLLAAGRAALELPGADPSGPLARALDKLAAALGAERPAIAVDFERPPQLDGVQAAVAASERLAVTYYTAGRDDLTERTIDPHGVFTERGHWYVVADDSRTGETRTFRVDRLEALAPTGEHFERRVVAPRFGAWFTADDVLVATLSLPASAGWIAETYPIYESTVEPGDPGGPGVGGEGRLRLRLPVFSERWLARLLLRAGPEARVLEPEHLATAGRDAAAALLERYR